MPPAMNSCGDPSSTCFVSRGVIQNCRTFSYGLNFTKALSLFIDMPPAATWLTCSYLKQYIIVYKGLVST